jgi:hypothetical protein
MAERDTRVEWTVCGIVQAALLGFDTQRVIALRLLRSAARGALVSLR